MRLTVIGCSPAWPNPGGAHSGYLVESGTGGRLLLDCGPGVLARLRAQELLPVDAIAITHLHLDHSGDLVPWAWLAAHGPGHLERPALWLPPGGRDELARFASSPWGSEGMFDRAFRIEEYVPGSPFEAAGFTVLAQPVEHYGLVAFGLRVEDEAGCVLAYSGDSGPCGGLRALAAGADLFLCEATLAAGGEDATPRGHLSAKEALAIPSGRTLLTHRPVELPAPAGAEIAAGGLVLELGS